MKPQKVNMNNQLFAITLLMVGLVIGVWLSTPVCYATDPEDLPWSNESDIIILPWSNETEILPMPPITPPPLPPFFSDFSITPTEIQIGDDLIISFVIENPNNQSITWMSATRIGGFFTQIIEIELGAYESKIIWYRIIPHLVTAQYDVWIDGQTGTFMVIPPDPWPVIDEVDPVIIIVDPLEELNEKMDYLNTTLQSLTTEFFLLQTDYNVEVEELNSKIDALEATLEIKTSRLQATIMFAFLAIAASVIGGFYFIKRMRVRARKI